MKPLSKEASDALSALKPTDPSAADEARVRKNLERTLGIVIPAASVAVATTAVSAQAATTASTVSGGVTAMSLGAKAVALVFVVGVGSTLTVLAVRERAPSVAVQQAVAPPRSGVEPEVMVDAVPAEVVPVIPEPVIAEPVQPAVVIAEPVQPAVVIAPLPRARPQPMAVAVPQVLAELPAEVVAAPPVVPAPPVNTPETYEQEIETHFPSCDVGTEMRSALSARKLLVAHRAEEALWLLGAYQRRCPSGRWSNEAWSVRIAGLCKLGRESEVTGLLEWFSNESPERRAAVVQDLRGWCSEEVLKHAD
jgi:hypothetical protein